MRIKASLLSNLLDKGRQGIYQVSMLVQLVELVNTKADIIKVKDEELQKLVPFGRDNVQNAVNALAKANIITNQQERDEKGQFNLNKIKLI